MVMREKRAIKLPWDEVCGIISSEIARVVGVQIQCKANVAESEFWSVEFTDRHLSLPQFCQLMQSMQPALKDWEYAMMGEIGADIKDMGPFTGEKIIGQNLHLTWEHRLITTDALWLVGVTEANNVQPAPDENERKFPDDLARAITVIADHLHQQEDKL